MRARTWQGIRVVGLLVAFGLLLYIFRDTDPRLVWESARKLNPLYLIPVALGLIAMPVARAYRLKYIMEPSRDIRFRRIFAIYNVGQMLNIVLPALTGQVGRVLLISRTLGLTKTYAFTSVMLEVLFDGVVLVVMISASSFLVVMPDWMLKGEVTILVGCLILLGFFYLILHRNRRGNGTPSRLRRRLPERLVQEWDNVKSSFLAALDMLTSRKHLFMTVLLSVTSWLAHALILLFLLRGFDIHLPLWGAILLLIVITLGIMVPVSPGNVGTFQLVCVAGLGLVGVHKEEALVFSIVLHVVELIPVFLLGALSSFSAHVRLREYMAPETLDEQDILPVEPEPDVPSGDQSDTGVAERVSTIPEPTDL